MVELAPPAEKPWYISEMFKGGGATKSAACESGERKQSNVCRPSGKLDPTRRCVNCPPRRQEKSGPPGGFRSRNRILYIASMVVLALRLRDAA
jgi:hypothetical protein